MGDAASSRGLSASGKHVLATSSLPLQEERPETSFSLSNAGLRGVPGYQLGEARNSGEAFRSVKHALAIYSLLLLGDALRARSSRAKHSGRARHRDSKGWEQGEERRMTLKTLV